MIDTLLQSTTRNPLRPLPRDPSLLVPPRSNPELDPRTLARWEDDGGYVPTIADERRKRSVIRPTPERRTTTLDADS